MIKLCNALSAWNTPEFPSVLKAEIEGLDVDLLPLQQGLAFGSHLAGREFRVMTLGATEEDGFIAARVGVFFRSIIAGCSCADDPTPADDNAEYCELHFAIDRRTGEATVSLPAGQGG